MKIDEVSIPKEASYNQAQLQMIRIHEIEKRIDSNLIDPLLTDEFGMINYNKILADLYNLLIIVYPKLSSDEKDEAMKAREFIQNFKKKYPVFSQVNKDGRAIEIFNPKHWDQLSEFIFQYRLLISELMDNHGLGNPDKQSPTTEAIN
jgi:hypothetical protein